MSDKIKNYADTWLYSQGDYEKNVFEFLMSADEINKKDDSFDDIKYEVKRRQVHNCLVKVLNNPNVILLYGDRELPRTFKVFAAKDVRHKTNGIKVYIDCTYLFCRENGAYELPIKNVDRFISYIVSALTSLIYHGAPNRLTSNATIINSTTEAFSRLFFYVIDYLRAGNVDKIKEKVTYLSALYYQFNIMDISGDAAKRRALGLSDLNEREADILELQTTKDTFKDINSFIGDLAKILKADSIPSGRLTTGVFTGKWVHLLGPSTIFGLELFPAFSSILTDTYVGSYINSQRTIEKICNKCVDNYTNQLLRLGSELLK